MKVFKNILRLSILMILFCGCKSNMERDFFEHMRTSYPDIKIDSSFYYIKSFGLSDSPQKIGENLYWKLHSDENAKFPLSGFLRKLNDSIMIVPDNYAYPEGGIREYKLFDFNAKPEQSWNALMESNSNLFKSNILSGDSIVFQRSEKLNQEEVYIYILYPYLFYPKSNIKDFRGGSFEVCVSKDKGIVSVTFFRSSIQMDAVYKAVLHPKILFINNNWELLDL